MNYDMTKGKRMGSSSKLAINLIILEFFLLFIQFFIGMWMNLFAVYPQFGTYPFGIMQGMMQVMFSVPELPVHMMIGILIGLISLMIFFVMATTGDRRFSLLSAGASLSILTAGISGLEFVFSDFSNNVFSFFMSIGFIFTVVIYASILYLIPSGRSWSSGASVR